MKIQKRNTPASTRLQSCRKQIQIKIETVQTILLTTTSTQPTASCKVVDEGGVVDGPYTILTPHEAQPGAHPDGHTAR